MGKKERLARSQIRSDFFFIDGGHLGVGQREKDDVAAPDRVGRFENFETISFCTNARFASAIKADDDLHPAIAQVERMCVSLCAKANNGAGFPFQPGKIDIFIAIDAHGHILPAQSRIANDPGSARCSSRNTKITKADRLPHVSPMKDVQQMGSGLAFQLGIV